MSNNLPAVPAQTSPLLSGKTYDRLKFLAQIVLPALGSFYAAVAVLWGLPAATQVVGTVVAVDTLLGAFLSLSTMVYNAQPQTFDGTLTVNETETKMIHQLYLDTPPDELAQKSAVVFKVEKSSVPLVSPYPEENLK